MRPRGEIRSALRDAAIHLAQGGGGTWLDLTRAAFGEQPGPLVQRAARIAIDNMARSGELAVVGRVRPAGRELAVYAPVAAVNGATAPARTPLEMAWGTNRCTA